jgi:hypothetical protein
MPKFGTVPPEVRVQGDPKFLAPKMREAALAVVADMAKAGHQARIFETLRTPERQAFLHGFGRVYDDGRGTVTKVADVWKGWHAYGLAVDIVQADATPWDAPQAFWQTLGKCAEAHGLRWGGRWKFLDLPHSQWGKAPMSPTAEDAKLAASAGLPAVWARYGA